MGNYKLVSDVDIVIKGAGISFSKTSTIGGILKEDTLMPYRFDVLGYNESKNDDLLEYIDRVRQLLYQMGTLGTVNEPPTRYKKTSKFWRAMLPVLQHNLKKRFDELKSYL